MVAIGLVKETRSLYRWSEVSEGDNVSHFPQLKSGLDLNGANAAHYCSPHALRDPGVDCTLLSLYTVQIVLAC